MSDANFDTNLIGQDLEVLFEEVMSRTIATSSITKNQNGRGFWIMLLPVCVLPVTEAVTRKLTCVMTCSDLDISGIEAYIVKTMRDNDSISKAIEIMVIGL